MLRPLLAALLALTALLWSCQAPEREVKAPGGGFAFAAVETEFVRPASREEVMALDQSLRARQQIATITRDADGRRVTILYVEPRTIDFPALAADAKKHDLEVKSFTLRSTGEIVEHHCDACLTTKRFLRLVSTGQEFELESARAQVGDLVLMEGEVLRWTSGRHLRIAAIAETEQLRPKAR
jgi:hypothetical protein